MCASTNASRSKCQRLLMHMGRRIVACFFSTGIATPAHHFFSRPVRHCRLPSLHFFFFIFTFLYRTLLQLLRNQVKKGRLALTRDLVRIVLSLGAHFIVQDCVYRVDAISSCERCRHPVCKGSSFCNRGVHIFTVESSKASKQEETKQKQNKRIQYEILLYSYVFFHWPIFFQLLFLPFLKTSAAVKRVCLLVRTLSTRRKIESRQHFSSC